MQGWKLIHVSKRGPWLQGDNNADKQMQLRMESTC